MRGYLLGNKSRTAAVESRKLRYTSIVQFGQGRVGVDSTGASRLLLRFRTSLQRSLKLLRSLDVGCSPDPDVHVSQDKIGRDELRISWVGITDEIGGLQTSPIQFYANGNASMEHSVYFGERRKDGDPIAWNLLGLRGLGKRSNYVIRIRISEPERLHFTCNDLM